MNRIEIINGLIKKNNYTNYLEIGVQGGECFRGVNCKNKTGVDPDTSSHATIHKTSDEFFESNKQMFDIIFIDGLHHDDQVIKDINNSLDALSIGGTIVMHDCLPTSKRMQEIPLQEQNEWTGNVWRAFVEFRKREDLNMCVVNCDWGCGIIREGKQKAIVVGDLTYEDFQVMKKELMNIIEPEQFKELYL